MDDETQKYRQALRDIRAAIAIRLGFSMYDDPVGHAERHAYTRALRIIDDACGIRGITDVFTDEGEPESADAALDTQD
jgi:hypothetical protein